MQILSGTGRICIRRSGLHSRVERSAFQSRALEVGRCHPQPPLVRSRPLPDDRFANRAPLGFAAT
eukprot:13638179-Alexandrium_andersonii.AAC.1